MSKENSENFILGNPEKNFKLVNLNGVMVPPSFLEPGREVELGEYIDGWQTQTANNTSRLKLEYSQRSGAWKRGATEAWSKHEVIVPRESYMTRKIKNKKK